MKNRQFETARGGDSSSRGSRESSTDDDVKGKSTPAAEGSEGGDVAGGEIAKLKQRKSASPASDADGGMAASSGQVSAPPVLDKKSELDRLSFEKSHEDGKELFVADFWRRVADFGRRLAGQSLKQGNPPTNLPSSEEAKKSSAVVTSSTLPLEIKPDIQSSPRSVDLGNIAGDNAEQLDKIPNVIDHEQEEGPEEIEGLDWDDTKLGKAIENCLEQFTYDLPPKDDEDFWYYSDQEQLKRLNEQVALHRIKAHMILEGAKLEELKDEELMNDYPSEVLEGEGYYEHYERDFEWYFDPEYIKHGGLQDYQRLVLRNDGHYLEYSYYCETLCTHEGDREFVEFYEKLSSKTKWIVKFLEVDKSEWSRYEHVAFYHAVKIAAGYRKIFLRLIYLGFQEYLWSIRFDNWTCQDIATLYFEIWKRVTKDKMDFVEALGQVYHLDVCAPRRLDIKLELGYKPGSGALKHNYETYLADIDEEVKDVVARSMIMKAVKAFVPKRKMYYDYAKMKLDIARDNGVIPLKDSSLSTIQMDNKEGDNGVIPPKDSSLSTIQMDNKEGHTTYRTLTRHGFQSSMLWELRKHVLLLATLAASVTYSAGLSPPGGFWSDNAGSRLAGDPVLGVTYGRRYEVFFYCNATAFVASIVIVNLLLAHSLSRRRWWLRALQAALILDQFGLMGAYAAGSCRELAMSAYVIALVGLVLLFVLLAMRARDTGEGVAPAPEAPPESVERTRKYLVTFATLAATVTYQAGLSTPGGFWSDSVDGDHLAGDPMLRGHHPSRFVAFFYLNTTAFVASLVVIMLLLSRTVTRHGFWSFALWVCTGAALIGLAGAFSVGCSRSIKTSIYVMALLLAVPFHIGVQVLVFLCKPVENFHHSVQEKMQGFLRLDNLNPQNHHHSQESNQQGNINADQLLKKSRKYLLLLSILAASVTYQAGLNPPGGFWHSNGSDGPHHYLAGDPVLHITYPRRYLVFFYCNATAFVASLVILILLSNIFSTQGIKYFALQIAVIMDLFGLIGAYAAGSCRQVSKSVYISVLAFPVLVFVLDVSPTFTTQRTPVREKLDSLMPNRLKKLLQPQTVEEDGYMEWKLETSRKLLQLLAVLAASLTYQLGMSPPGGFWQENTSGHVGDPMLNDNYRHRYLAFIYCNATAFFATLAIIMLLVNRKISARVALRMCSILALMGLMGAFAAGSSWKVSTSICVFVLVFAVLVCIAFQVAVVVSGSDRSLMQKILSPFAVREDEEANDLLPQKIDFSGIRDLRDEKLPKYLLLIAALAAAVTYQAAMSPPGGLWDDGQKSHIAGYPVLRSTYPRRYKVFFYCNATSFAASLVIMVLLPIKRVSKAQSAHLAMRTAMILDLFGLMGAYAAGSSRSVWMSAYILALFIGVSAYIVIVSVGVLYRRFSVDVM